MVSQGILPLLVWILYNSLSNEVVLQSFPTVLKYSMCWLSQLNGSEFIYKLLCFAFFFFTSLFLPSLSKAQIVCREKKHINSVIQYNKEQLVKNVLLVHVEHQLFLFLSRRGTECISWGCSGSSIFKPSFFLVPVKARKIFFSVEIMCVFL